MDILLQSGIKSIYLTILPYLDDLKVTPYPTVGSCRQHELKRYEKEIFNVNKSKCCFNFSVLVLTTFYRKYLANT